MDNRTRFGFSYNHLFVQRKELIMGCVDDALLMDTVGIGCLQMLLDRLLFTLIRIEVVFLFNMSATFTGMHSLDHVKSIHSIYQSLNAMNSLMCRNIP